MPCFMPNNKWLKRNKAFLCELLKIQGHQRLEKDCFVIQSEEAISPWTLEKNTVFSTDAVVAVHSV